MPPNCAYGAGRGHFHGLGPLWDLSAADSAAAGVPARVPIRCTVTTFRGDLSRMNYEIGDQAARSGDEPQ